MEKPSPASHLRAILFLPFIVTVVIPWFILRGTHQGPAYSKPLVLCTGSALMLSGILVMTITIIQFHRQGFGTLAPWNPTRKLVTSGIYRYLRNPMISGVVCLLLGEATFFTSPWLFLWAVCFFGINHLYFVYSEEPGLLKRFGEDYLAYMDKVPRWIPRNPRMR